MPHKDIKLSVIVTIYKVEKYLNQCIESILSQDYPFFELILVDDGSPDQCPAICDKYAETDSRVEVIHQPNQGVVCARWNGILASSGKYITFVDGDDWIEPNMYSNMMNITVANTADLVVVGFRLEEPEKTILERNNLDSGIFSNEKMEYIFQKAMYTGKYYHAGITAWLCNKVIRRDLFFEHFKPAAPIIRFGEDAAVTYPMIAWAKTVVIDNEDHPYHYRILEESMSHSSEDDLYFERTIALLKGLYENLASNRLMQTGLKYYGIYLSHVGIMSLFALSNKTSLKQKMKILKHYYTQYRTIGITDEIDWSGFNKRDKNLLQAFITGRLRLMMLRLYKDKVNVKIMNALRKVKSKTDSLW